MLKVAKTPDGNVVRIIRAGGECAYRRHLDGTWAMCGAHRGPWISLPERDVPKTARAIEETFRLQPETSF